MYLVVILKMKMMVWCRWMRRKGDNIELNDEDWATVTLSQFHCKAKRYEETSILCTRLVKIGATKENAF